jgi:tetratricopeptide (TPR) repeat protein
MEAELANVRAAHRWAIDNDPQLAADLVASLYWYAYWYGTAEVFGWADRTVERVAGVAPGRLVGALGTAALGSCRRGDLVGATALAEQAIAISGDGDASAARFAWDALRSAKLLAGRYEQALECRDRAIDLARRVGDTAQEIHAHTVGALLLGYLGRRDESDAELIAATHLLAVHHHPILRAFHDYVAGEVRVDTSPAEALPFLRRSVEAARRMGCRFLAGIAGVSAVSCAARTGDPSVTISEYAEVLEFLHRAGAWPQLWTTLRALVETLAHAGRYESAAILHGALTSSPTAPPILGMDEARMNDVLAVLGVELGDDRLAELRSDGAGLDAEQAYAFALDLVR